MVLLVVGQLILMHGRGLPNWQEEEECFQNEILHGQPGFRRARAILGGIILMIAGVIGIISTIFSG